MTSGTWTGNPAPTITYQWLVDDVEVDGATSSSYVIQAADAGLMVSVAVTGTNSEGSATEVVGVGPVNAAPANVDVQVGETLTVSDGTWTGFPAPVISYAWFTSPDGSAWTPTGVDTADYTLQAADEGQYFFVQVTGDNGVGSPIIAEAAAVGPVLAA